MRRTIWLVPLLAAGMTVLSALWPSPASQSDSPLTAVFGGPDAAEARRRISIPFGFTSTDLSHHRRVVDAEGTIVCGIEPTDHFFQVEVVIQQGDAVARGTTYGRCTGEEQTWRVRAVTRSREAFHPGPATGQWFFTFHYRGEVVESLSGQPTTLQLA
ncbi:MAG: hypothetical protein ACRD07_05210 [Acidimicrobiales bacterium]